LGLASQKMKTFNYFGTPNHHKKFSKQKDEQKSNSEFYVQQPIDLFFLNQRISILINRFRENSAKQSWMRKKKSVFLVP
jgi:hypothetical protein